MRWDSQSCTATWDIPSCTSARNWSTGELIKRHSWFDTNSPKPKTDYEIALDELNLDFPGLRTE